MDHNRVKGVRRCQQMKNIAKRPPYYLLVLPAMHLCLCFFIQFSHAEGSWGWFLVFAVDIPFSALIVATTHPLRDFGTLGTLWWFFLSWSLMRFMRSFSGESQPKSKRQEAPMENAVELSSNLNDPVVAFIKRLLPSVVVEPDTKPEPGLEGPSYHILLPHPVGADYRITLWLGSGEKQISAQLLNADESAGFWYMPFEKTAFRSVEQLDKEFLETVELLVRHNTRIEQRRGVFFNQFKCECESGDGWKRVYGCSSLRWIRAAKTQGSGQVYRPPSLVGCI